MESYANDAAFTAIEHMAILEGDHDCNLMPFHIGEADLAGVTITRLSEGWVATFDLNLDERTRQDDGLPTPWYEPTYPDALTTTHAATFAGAVCGAYEKAAAVIRDALRAQDN